MSKCSDICECKLKIFTFYPNSFNKMSSIQELVLESHIRDYETFVSLIQNFCQLDPNFNENIHEIHRKVVQNPKVAVNLYKLTESKLTELPKYLFQNKSSTVFRSIKTVNGYAFDLMKSALQKYIRRGHIEEALYSAFEMYMFKYLSGGQAAYTNFINRIRVITLEDIGLGSPSMVITVNNLLNRLSESKNDRESFVIVAQIVYNMCNSLHYRFYSHIRSFVSDHKLESPSGFTHTYDLKLDQEFSKDVNDLIYGLENKSLTVASSILNIFNSEEKLKTKRYKSTKPRFLAMDIVEWFLKKNKASQMHLKIHDTCLEWLKTLNVQESFLCALHPVYSYLFFSDIPKPQEIKLNDDPIDLIQKNLTNQPLSIHGYIKDKHTKAGRNTGKTTADFALEGSLVGYENVKLRKTIENTHKLSYLYMKHRSKDNVLKESDVFQLKVRAQLTCSQARPDVYYALEKGTNKNIVVKGPFMEYEQANKAYQVFRIMSLFPEINTVDVNLKLLIPDMFESVGVGIRNKASKNTPYYFLVLQDLFNQDEYPVEIRNSKCWTDTEVVDYDKLFKSGNMGFAVPSSMNQTQRLSLVHQLAFRYAFEIGDMAARNLCYTGDKAYNLDSDDVFVGQIIKWKKTERDILGKVFNENKDTLTVIWQEWLTSSNTTYYDRWYTVKQILNLSDIQVNKIRQNIEYIIESFDTWITG